MESVIKTVSAEYEKILDEKQERTLNNLLKVLVKNEINDELTKARILSRQKSFIEKIFNESVEQGSL